MTCAEFKELAGALALGALDPDERASAEAHLQSPDHDGCRELVAKMGDASHLLALGLPPVKPGPQVWEAIAQQTSRSKPTNAGKYLGWGVAAALAAAVVVLIAYPPGNPGEEQRLVAAERERCTGEMQSKAADRELERKLVDMLDSPTSRLLSLQPQSGIPNRATAVLDLSARKAMVLSRSLPPESGKDYELWIISGKTATPAGLIHQLDDGLAIGDFSSSHLAGAVDAVAISVEPAGGSAQPTRVLLVGSVKG